MVANFFYYNFTNDKSTIFCQFNPYSGDNIYCAIFVCSYKLSYKFAALLSKKVCRNY